MLKRKRIFELFVMPEVNESTSDSMTRVTADAYNGNIEAPCRRVNYLATQNVTLWFANFIIVNITSR